MIDVKTATEAQKDALWLADHWTHLEARLQPGSSAAASEVRAPSPDPALPIDLHVSDLMAEIDTLGWTRCHELMMETDDVASMPSTPEARLRLMAERYGHWVTGEERMALEFCDQVSDHRERVRKVLERPAPPRYVGPCSAGECTGDLYVAEGKDGGTCRTCGTEWLGPDQRAYVGKEMAERLMTQTEIRRALTILGMPVPEGTIKTWVHRGRLKPVEEGLYSLVAATALAEERGARAALTKAG